MPYLPLVNRYIQTLDQNTLYFYKRLHSTSLNKVEGSEVLLFNLKKLRSAQYDMSVTLDGGPFLLQILDYLRFEDKWNVHIKKKRLENSDHPSMGDAI